MDDIQVVKSRILWLSDGNLIVIADNTAYRVYGGVLTKYSPALSNILDVEQAETFDGLPVVRFSDCKNAAEKFLRALYDPCFFDPLRPQDIDTVASVLHLSFKYGVRFLQNRATQLLNNTYPSTAREEQCCTTNDKMARPRLHDSPGMHIVALALSRTFRIPLIEPYAFYQICATMSFAEMQETVVLQDGTTYALDPEDLAVCLQGQAVLLLRFHRFARRSMYAVADACANPDKCRTDRLDLLERISRQIDLGGHCDPLHIEWHDVAEPDVCLACYELFRRKHDVNCRRLWFELPSLFGLEDWDTLNKRASDIADAEVQNMLVC